MEAEDGDDISDDGVDEVEGEELMSVMRVMAMWKCRR